MTDGDQEGKPPVDNSTNSPEHRDGSPSEDRTGPVDRLDHSEGQGAQRSIAFHGFQGPFPPPDILEGYNRVDPNFAERMIAWTEKEQDQRHRHNEEEQRQKHMHILRGQVMTLMIALAGIAAAGVVAIWGKGLWAPIGAGLIAASVFGFLAVVIRVSVAKPQPQSSKKPEHDS